MPWVRNQGPFPRPELPGVLGTTGLSATPIGPSCPSREHGWRSRTAAEGVSRVALDLHMQTCRLLYPGGTAGSNRSRVGVFQPITQIPATTAFPRSLMGRLPRRKFLGLIGSVLALRPTCSRDRQAALCIEGSDGFVTSTAAPIATGGNDPVAGRESHPLKIQAFPRRTMTPFFLVLLFPGTICYKMI